MRRPLIVLVVCVLCGSPSPRADACLIAPHTRDAGIACIDIETGKVRWRRADTFKDPALRIEGDRVVVEELGEPRGPVRVVPRRDGTIPAITPRIEAFDPRSGTPVELAPSERIVEPLVALDDDWLLAGDVVIAISDADPLVVEGTRGGTPAWRIDVRRYVPRSRDVDYVSIALDHGSLLVTADRWVLSFSIRQRPRLRWRTTLPRPRNRPHDTSATLARDGDTLFVMREHDLIALRARDGKLRWRFDAGRFADPSPLVYDGSVFVTFRPPPRRRGPPMYTR